MAKTKIVNNINYARLSCNTLSIDGDCDSQDQQVVFEFIASIWLLLGFYLHFANLLWMVFLSISCTRESERAKKAFPNPRIRMSNLKSCQFHYGWKFFDRKKTKPINSIIKFIRSLARNFDFWNFQAIDHFNWIRFDLIFYVFIFAVSFNVCKHAIPNWMGSCNTRCNSLFQLKTNKSTNIESE